MPRYRAVLAYDGSAYCGFQRQLEGIPTIQAVLEDTLTRMTGHQTIVLGAGRTDTGVHASGQVIGFTVAGWRHGDAILLKALNAHLPPDIAIQTLERAADDFHPRYHAQARLYRYRVLVADQRQPLWHGRAWWLWGQLAGDALSAAAERLLGKHDFAAFGQAPQVGSHTVRTVYRSEWQMQREGRAELWTYTVQADAFLQHMVRRMVWLQIQVGRGEMALETFQTIFTSCDLWQVRGVAPPQGLTLEEVTYQPLR